MRSEDLLSNTLKFVETNNQYGESWNKRFKTSFVWLIAAGFLFFSAGWPYLYFISVDPSMLFVVILFVLPMLLAVFNIFVCIRKKSQVEKISHQVNVAVARFKNGEPPYDGNDAEERLASAIETITGRKRDTWSAGK